MAHSKALDHRQVVASLSGEEREWLLAKSDSAGVRQLALHAGAITIFATLIGWRVPYWQVLSLPQGILLIFLFTALHEATHLTAFKSEHLNRVVAAVCGFIIFVQPAWFRYFHLAHHRYTHDRERDPELEGGKPETLAAYIKYLSGIPVWIGNVRVLIRNAVRGTSDLYVPEKARERVKLEARLYLLIYATLIVTSIWFRSDLLLRIWIVPIFIGQPFLRAYLLAEHTRCPHVSNMFENTRTTFTLALVRFIAWNMPYHAEHHAYPNVPFHKLPAFHELVAQHLRCTEQGYIRFHYKLTESLSGKSP